MTYVQDSIKKVAVAVGGGGGDGPDLEKILILAGLGALGFMLYKEAKK